MSLDSSKISFIAFILILTLPGCDDLDVQNLNDPDFEKVRSSPDYIKETASSLINNWFMTTHEYRGWALPLLGAADAGTSSWTYTRPYSNSFSITSEWLPGETWSSDEFGQLANPFAARLLVYSSRNKLDDNQTDWSEVYSYAANGIKKDFAPLADDDNWHSYYHAYANYFGFTQTDMYVVNIMDPAMPARWVDADTWDVLPEPVSSHKDGVDDRIFTDFQYLSSCPFRPERGYYHFSCYRYSRLDHYLTTWTEPMPEFRKAENDYLLAEAAAHTGKLQEAADIINESPRVTRGGLTPVPADQDSIFDAIHHERMVELMSSGMGIQFFQMRKENKLQPGSPLHYPIPGSQLEIMQTEYYTFGGTEGESGGVEGIPGIDFSTGGW